MHITEYQVRAGQTAVYPTLAQLCGIENGCALPPHAYTNPFYPALGLAGEAGEFCNKLKKVMRDNKGEITPEFRKNASKELGDILWYVAACASELNLNLLDIAQDNLEKLASRKERGVIGGAGDDR